MYLVIESKKKKQLHISALGVFGLWTRTAAIGIGIGIGIGVGVGVGVGIGGGWLKVVEGGQTACPAHVDCFGQGPPLLLEPLHGDGLEFDADGRVLLQHLPQVFFRQAEEVGVADAFDARRAPISQGA